MALLDVMVGTYANQALNYLASGVAPSSIGNDELLSTLHDLAITDGPINSVERAFDDPQVRYRQMAISTDRDDGSSLPGVRTPIRFLRSSLTFGRPSPMLAGGAARCP